MSDGKDMICEMAAHSFSTFSRSLIFGGGGAEQPRRLAVKTPLPTFALEIA